MLIISSQIDLNGERWFFPYKKPAGSKKEFTPEDEALFKLRLLVASSENPQYRSRNALVRRHIDKMDASYQVGTDALISPVWARLTRLMIFSSTIARAFFGKTGEGVGSWWMVRRRP